MRKAVAITILIGIFVLFPVWFFLNMQFEKQLVKEQQMQNTEQLSRYANALEKVIQQRFSLLEGLHAFVLSNPQAEQLDNKFLIFASALHTGTKGIRNFALAPDGINGYVFPLKENEKVIGHNLINDSRPNVKKDVQRAIDYRKITLSGPYQLRQGGLGLVARKAVFQKDKLWGLATMVIDMPPAFAEAGLDSPQSLPVIGLRKGSGEIFFGPEQAFGPSSLSHRIELPDGFWEIATIPSQELAPHLKRQLNRFNIFSLLAGGLLSFLIFFIASRQSYLTQKIKEQTLNLQKRLVERKAAEQSLAESEERLRALIESSPIGLALCTMDGSLVTVNPAYAKIIGYSVEESLQLTYWDVTPKKYAAQEEQRLKQLMTAGRYGPYEKEYRHKDEHLVPVRLNGMLINQNDTDYIWSSVEDITALKKAEEDNHQMAEQLRQAQKMEAIGTLAGGVAHDFNNILAAILGYTELTLLHSDRDAKSKKHLEGILTAVERAKKLVNQILTFSKKGEEYHSPIKIDEVILEAINLLKKTLPATISFKLDIDSDLATVMADPTQIHQVIMNLCTNAYHSMPNYTGTINVSLKQTYVDSVAAGKKTNLHPGRYNLLTVADTGAGIPAEIIDRIFEPFFTTKGQAQGTGMGLAVVHGIVQNHGGAIGITSVVGKGTTFEIFFPVKLEQIKNRQKKDPEPISKQGTERILWIDDEAILAELGKESLQAYGYTVTSTTSPIDALNIFKAAPQSYDLIITDQTMPEMTGNILAEKILDIRPDTPIIICTGHSALLNEDKVKKIGAKALLMKPLTVNILIREVRKILDGIADEGKGK